MNLSEALYTIRRMPYCMARVEAIKEGIREADQLGETYFSFSFRDELIDDACISGTYSDIRDAMGALGWILKKEEDGTLEQAKIKLSLRYLSHQQWICRWIILYPDITIAQLDKLLADLKRRMKEGGHSLRFYHEAVLISAALTDRREMADAAYQQYRLAKEDWFVDCPDCIACRYIKYFRYTGEHDKAMRTAAGIDTSCNMNPKTAYNELVASAVESGNLEGIEVYQPQAYKMISKDAFFIDFIGHHMQYYSLTDMPKALAIYKKHLAWAYARNRFPLTLYDFHTGATVFFRRYLTKKKSFKGVLPKVFPLYDPDVKYDVQALSEYHYKTALELAEKFDRRNGTGYYKEKLARLTNI